MENKKIIGLVGQIASGKGTVAKYFEKNYGAVTFRFSTILRDVLNRLHQVIDRQTMQKLSTAVRQVFGEDILAKVMADDVKDEKNKIIVVDGIRRMADIKYLKKIPGFILVGIAADAKIRYDRLIKRNENYGDQNKAFAEFLEDQKKEADAEIPLVLKNANIVINNDGNFENLNQQIDNIIKK